MINTTPTARTEHLVMQTLENEVLLYDLKTNKAFCLNETCAFVYERCDGKRTFDELRAESGKELSDEVIWLAIDELAKQNLLKTKPESGISRRSLLQKAAASAVALPIITSLVAPLAVHAQSAAVCAVEDGAPNGTQVGTSSSQLEVFCDNFNEACCSGFAAEQNCVVVAGGFTNCDCVCAEPTPEP